MKKKTPKKITWPAFIVTIVIIVLLGYAIVDASISKPKIHEKVEHVSNEFDSLKIFLDAKLPEIDKALIMHTEQIERQNEQLERLNELAESLKEE